MGKKIIIKGADFSANAIPVAKAVNGTTSPQYVYIANVNNPSAGFDWDSCKREIQIHADGSITSFNLPQNTVALPNFVYGSGESNNWLKEIDLSYLSECPISSIRRMLSECKALGRVILGGNFNSLTEVLYFLYESNSDEVIIDDSFNAPILRSLDSMFYSSMISSVKGLKHLIKSSITNIESLFFNCDKIREIDLSGCDTSNVINMKYTFKSSDNIENIIGLNVLDTRKVTSFLETFRGCGKFGTLDISNWNIAENVNTKMMFYETGAYELNANCFTALYGDVTGMFFLKKWNTIHLDNLNDVSAVTQSTDLFSADVSGTPKVTIANVTNQDVKTLLTSALNARSVGGSSNWHETTIDGVLCLVP